MQWFTIILIVLLLAAAAAGLLFLLMCLIIGWILLAQVLYPAHYDYKYTRENDEKNGFTRCFEDYERLWERHEFELESGDITLVGEYIVNPASTGRKKVAVICHGQTVNLMAAVKYGKIFYDMGYNLVLYDHRYFGYSGGKYSTLGYKESGDLINVLRKTRELFGSDCELCLHGESMGSATALLALAKPESDRLVDYAIVDCPFAGSRRLFMEVCRNNYRINGSIFLRFSRMFARFYGYDFFGANPMEGAERSEKPILFIHGDADKLIHYSHSVDMAARCRNPLSRCELFAGAAHARSYAIDQPRYEALIRDFCAQAERK